jgi:hypothetical protein
LLAAVMGCATPVAPDGMLLGVWGGAHLQLTADSSGAQLQYDCATGLIDVPVMVAGGQVTATGVHMPGHGGPSRIGDVPVRRPASYSGVLSGGHLTLTVTLLDTGERVGVFTLTKGQPGFIVSCL